MIWKTGPLLDRKSKKHAEHSSKIHTESRLLTKSIKFMFSCDWHTKKMLCSLFQFIKAKVKGTFQCVWGNSLYNAKDTYYELISVLLYW